MDNSVMTDSVCSLEPDQDISSLDQTNDIRYLTKTSNFLEQPPRSHILPKLHSF